jgi:hypothetical protein
MPLALRKKVSASRTVLSTSIPSRGSICAVTSLAMSFSQALADSLIM